MAKAGHNITIITHKSNAYSQRFTDHGITVIEKPIIKKVSIASILLIRSTIKHSTIDIVYATNSKSIPNAALACTGLKVKLVEQVGCTGMTTLEIIWVC